MSNIRKATRQNVKPLVALYAESGAGKTYSSLLLARGFVGPSGKIIMVDTERGRGELYADVAELGGYDVLPLSEPYSPANYVAAIAEVESQGYQIGILDSGSHEWEGPGSVLDMAAANEEKSGKAGLHNWRTPKFEHAKFVARLMRSPIPWIICLRAKFKSRQSKDERGKTVIVKDETLSPIQAEDFLFEMTAHGEIDGAHKFYVRKWSHPELLKCFPKDQPLNIEHGAMLAHWCAAPTSSKLASPSKPPAVWVSALKAELWEIGRPIHQSDPGDGPEEKKLAIKRLEQYLWDEALMADTETLSTLPPERLSQVIEKLKVKLKPT